MIFEHKTLPEFWKCYNALPEEAQRRADKQFALLSENPMHPSIHLKPVGEFWSARVTDASRALARKGKVHPHARHWQTLADLVGISPANQRG